MPGHLRVPPRALLKRHLQNPRLHPTSIPRNMSSPLRIRRNNQPILSSLDDRKLPPRPALGIGDRDIRQTAQEDDDLLCGRDVEAAIKVWGDSGVAYQTYVGEWEGGGAGDAGGGGGGERSADLPALERGGVLEGCGECCCAEVFWWCEGGGRWEVGLRLGKGEGSCAGEKRCGKYGQRGCEFHGRGVDSVGCLFSCGLDE